MKRSQLTRILVEGDPKLLQDLSNQVEQQYEVNVVKSPEKSLVMMKSRDAVSQKPFYIGEVLVTECTVSIGDVYGFGILMGEDAERAYQLAVVDSAINAKLSICDQWNSLLMEEEEKMKQRNRKEMAQVIRTKVNFDTKEDYNA